MLDVMAQGEQQEYCVQWKYVHDKLAIKSNAAFTHV
jgi:hypothetical protein